MKKLLLLESDPMIGSVYSFHFSSAGYEVEQVDDGRKGLQAIDQVCPAVLVLDLMLPRVNGVDFIRRVRSQASTVSLPIVAFANEYEKAVLAAAKQAGADECVIKAKMSAESLLAAVARAVGMHAPPEVPSPSAPSPQPLRDPEPEPVTPPPPTLAPRSPPAAVVSTSEEESIRPSRVLMPPPEPLEAFLKSAPQALAQLRTLSQNLIRCEREANQPPIVFDLYQAVHTLTSKAGLAGAQLFAQVSSATEALLRELDAKPNRIDASTIRTVNQAVDFLGLLFLRISPRPHECLLDFRILVVDDDVVSRKAMVRALELASLKSVSLDDPFAAYEWAKKEPLDLIVTDINMPGMDGCELCAKVRALPINARTPVIFVTNLNGFETRVRSAQSGGDDFIGKPFLCIELAVKALTHILRSQLKDSRPAFQSFRPETR